MTAFRKPAATPADEALPVTSIYRPGEPSAEERFFARRNRRAAKIWRTAPAEALFRLDGAVLVDLDPGIATWRAAGCPAAETHAEPDTRAHRPIDDASSF